MAAEFPELRKLDTPPAAINWARLNDPNPTKTAKRLVQFSLRPPRWSYHPANSAIHDRIVMGLDRKTARATAARRGNPIGRPYNISLVEAFFDHDEKRGYAGQRLYGEVFTEYFKLSPEIWIPVKPLVVVVQNGKIIPIFLCGWNSLDLSLFQRRLFMTVVEDAFFTLTDFQSAHGEFLFFPRTVDGEIASDDESKGRAPEIWRRGDYALLSEQELQDQAACYLAARELARPIIIEQLRKRATKDSTDSERSGDRPDDKSSPMFDF